MLYILKSILLGLDAGEWILPSYLRTMISHSADPNKPTTTIEWHHSILSTAQRVPLSLLEDTLEESLRSFGKLVGFKILGWFYRGLRRIQETSGGIGSSE